MSAHKSSVVGRAVAALVESLEIRRLLNATLTPTADTYVRDGSTASTVYGAYNTMQAKQGASGVQRQSFIKFDISSITDSVTGATLRLNGKRSGTADSTFQIAVDQLADNTWNETSTNWNNKPVVSSTIATPAITSTTAVWTDVDVTSYIQAAKAANQTYVSLAVVGAASTNDYYEMSSREGTSPPQLVLTTQAAAAPTAPTSLAVTSNLPGAVALSWTDNSNNETGFKVERKAGTGAWTTLTTTALAANATTYTDTTAAANTAYTYRVYATGSTNSGYSNEVAVTTPDVTTQTLYATDDSYTRMGSYANDNYGSDTTLLAKSGTTNDRKIFIKFQVPAGVTSITNANFRIYASRTSTVDGASLPFDVKIVPTTTWSESTITYANQPTIGSTTLGTVTLTSTTNSWFSVDLTTYVQQQLAAGQHDISVAIVGDVSNTDAAISVVSSESTTGNGPQLVISSPVASGPSAPTGFTAAALSPTTVRLNWTDTSSNETGFQIGYRVQGSTGGYAIATLAANTTTTDITGLSPNTTYEFNIIAKGTPDSGLASTTGTSLVSPTITSSATKQEGSPISMGVDFGSLIPSGTFAFNWTSSGGTFSNVGAAAPNFTPADDGTVTTNAAITYPNGDIINASTSLSVSNVVPTLGLAGDASTATYTAYTLGLNHSDPGADTISSWSINWGDGSAVQSLDGTLSETTHTFAAAGTYTINAAATDEDGTYSVTKSIAVSEIIVSGATGLATLLSTHFDPSVKDQHLNLNFDAPVGPSAYTLSVLNLKHDSAVGTGTPSLSPDQLTTAYPLQGYPLDNGWYESYVRSQALAKDEYESTFSFVNADFDSNGVTDFNDFLVIQANMGQSGSDVTFAKGDANYDHKIDFNDFLILQANFGVTVPPLSTQAGDVAVANTAPYSLDVGWTADDQARDGFKIYRSDDDGATYQLVKTLDDPTARTWTDTNLTGGKKYWYRVRAYTDANGVSASEDKASGVVPEVPVFSASFDPPVVSLHEQTNLNLTATGVWALGVTEWQVTWDNGTTIDITSPPVAATATQATWTIPLNYASAGSRVISARAKDAAGWHDPVSATLIVANTPPEVMAPDSLTTNISTITLHATGSDDDGESNLVYDWTITSIPDGAPTPHLTGQGVNGSKDTQVEFQKAGYYEFTVTATDKGGLTSDYTVSVEVEQGPSNLTIAPGTTHMTAGDTRHFTANVTDQFGDPIDNADVKWTADTGAIDEQGIYRVSGTATEDYVHASLGGDEEDGNSELNDDAYVTIGLNVPQHLSVDAANGTDVNLAWDNDGYGDTQISIEMSTDGETFSEVAIAPANSFHWAVPNLTPGTTYWFQIKAKYGSIKSDPTDPVSVKMPNWQRLTTLTTDTYKVDSPPPPIKYFGETIDPKYQYRVVYVSGYVDVHVDEVNHNDLFSVGGQVFDSDGNSFGTTKVDSSNIEDFKSLIGTGVDVGWAHTSRLGVAFYDLPGDYTDNGGGSITWALERRPVPEPTVSIGFGDSTDSDRQSDQANEVQLDSSGWTDNKITFTISRSGNDEDGDLENALNVKLQGQLGTADPVSDYGFDPEDDTITIPPHKNSINVTLTAYPDDKTEGDESVIFSLKADQNYRLTPGQYTATGTIHDVAVDLLVDSNNDGKIDSRDEEVEDDVGKSGKVLKVNDDDTDRDGIPDYSDGFGFFNPGGFTPDDDQVAGETFTPVEISVTAGLVSANGTYTFDYSGSDPAAVTRTGSGTSTDPFIYDAPPSGAIRLWTKPGDVKRDYSDITNGGDYITPGTTYTADDLGLSGSGKVTLYIEGINPSTGMGDQQIAFAAHVGGKTLNDLIFLTVAPNLIRTDGNRDNSITFDAKDDKDYYFWTNNNLDGNDDIDGVSVPQDLLTVDGHYGTDSRDVSISNTRDLEDFMHIEVNVPTWFDATDGWSLRLHWDGGTSSLGTAGINTFIVDQNTGDHYLDTSAAEQSALNAQYLKRFAGIRDYDVSAHDMAQWAGTSGKINLLVEGVSVGDGKLSVQWMQNKHVAVQDSVYLKLRTVRSMYDEYSNAIGSGVDQNGNWINADDPTASGTFRVAQTATLANTNSVPKMATSNDYIVFVHGWNNRKDDRIASANTAFKRLFWAGFSGRFATFAWPTRYQPQSYLDDNGPVLDPGNFDQSEFVALESAAAFNDALSKIKTEQATLGSSDGSQKVTVLAHSQGNYVLDEALRTAPAQMVDNAIMSQAAVSSDYFDASASMPIIYNVPSPNSHVHVTNGYRTYDGVPAIDSLGGSSPRYQVSKLKAGRVVNFFNVDDGALAGWDIDQSQKPSSDFRRADHVTRASQVTSLRYFLGAVSAHRYFNGAAYDIGSGVVQRSNSTGLMSDGTPSYSLYSPLTGPQSQVLHETTAFGIGSDGLAVGENPFLGTAQGIAPVNLQGLSSKFNGSRAGHSSQFYYSLPDVEQYWKQVFTESKL